MTNFTETRIAIDVGVTEAERLRHALGMSIRSPGLNPQNVFTLLVAILKQQFPEDTPKYVREFRAYVQARPPDGLGMDPKELVKLVDEFRHPHEVGALRSQTTVDEMVWMRKRVERLLLGTLGADGGDRGNQHTGGSRQSDNVTLPERGNSRAYILARLDRAHEEDGPHPEFAALAAKVRAREMSARAAAIEAGWRRPPSPLKAIQSAWSRATDDERRAIRAWWAEQ